MTPEMLSLKPIGRVIGGRADPLDDNWGGVEAVISLDAQIFGTEATAGLEEFSHLEVIYVFHRASDDAVTLGARHPRGRTDWPKVGIFAQRGKDRPNHLGLSRCRLVRVEGLDLHVTDLDAIDGTPVLDVKPWMTEFEPRGRTRQPPWATELMQAYY